VYRVLQQHCPPLRTKNIERETAELYSLGTSYLAKWRKHKEILVVRGEHRATAQVFRGVNKGYKVKGTQRVREKKVLVGRKEVESQMPIFHRDTRKLG